MVAAVVVLADTKAIGFQRIPEIKTGYVRGALGRYLFYRLSEGLVPMAVLGTNSIQSTISLSRELMCPGLG